VCHDPHWPGHSRRRGAACEHGPPERQLGALANGLHEAVDGVRRERTPALSLEDERTRGIPLQLAQHAQFITPDRVNCGLAVLRPADVERRIATPFDLRPFQVGDFDGPQTVAKGHEDQRGVPVAMSAQASRPRSASRPRPASGIRGCASEHSAFVSALSEKCCLARPPAGSAP
jgi:hypothetical protein